MALEKLSRAVLARRVQDPDQNSRLEGLRTAAVALETRAEYVHEVSRLWSEARTRFLAIGHHLLQAKATLPHGEYQLMIETELPFGRNVALQLKTVAEAVGAARLAEPELPKSYATAYLLASLPDDLLNLARERELVRPDVPRRAIEAFRRKVRTSADGDRRRQLEREQRRLQAAIADAQTRIRNIASELAAIDGEISDEEP